MLQIETYNGSLEDLVEFVNSVWTDSYAGKMTFPCWTSPFMEWQFRLSDNPSRRNLIAAYDGSVLAGVLLGTDFSYRSPAGLHGGSQWSWLSIHPEYRGRGIAKALNEERVARQMADKSRLIVSFRFVGSPFSLAERPQGTSEDQKFNRKVGFWARVLHPHRFADWHWNRTEGFLAKLAAPLCRVPTFSKSNLTIRPFRMSDLDACVDLAKESYAHLMLSIVWDHDSLRHQLSGSDVVQTLVVEEGGRVTGFVNFHILMYRAKTIEKVAVFDLIALGKATSRAGIQLLNAALAHMQDQGAVLALKVRTGDVPAWPMLRTNFVLKPPDSFLVFQSVGEQIDIPKTGSVHVLWR